MASRDPEPWDSHAVLDGHLHRLLSVIDAEGPMHEDHVARFCLHPQELVGLINDQDRSQMAMNTTEAMAAFLSPQGGAKPLADAIKLWRKHASLVRWSFEWKDLPPAILRKAQKRRGTLLDEASSRRWLACNEVEGIWSITDAGKDALRRFEAGEQ